eukprot:4509557-Pyramimonas_sp.AAC.2
MLTRGIRVEGRGGQEKSEGCRAGHLQQRVAATEAATEAAVEVEGLDEGGWEKALEGLRLW